MHKKMHYIGYPAKKGQVRFISVFVFYVCAFFIVIAFLSGCDGGVFGIRGLNRDSGHISETRLLMDTVCTITIHGDFDTGLLDEAFQLCVEYEALLSMTMEGSDVWRINHAGGEPVPVDPRTIEVINAGLVFGEFSGGLFDITIGRLSRLWDFGNEQNVPSEAEIDAARSTVDYRQVLVSGDTVQLLDPDAWIDLGAIAKGYIAYKTAEFLVANNVSGALVDMGRDIVTIGSRHDGTPWRIAVQDPFGDASDWLGVLEVKWVSVLSSGIYERQFEKNGVIYHHILDPGTGMPVKSDVISATVITQTGVTGEGLSTLAILAGSERAQELFKRAHGFIGAVLVLDNGEVLKIGDIDFRLIE